MNIKRVVILTLAFLVVAGGAAVASSRWGSYEGFSKVQVNVNNEALPAGEVPAFVINGKTVLPLRETTDALHAIIKWDNENQTTNIYKPNVNMIVAEGLGSKKNTVDNVERPFFKATLGKNIQVKIFVQVDNLLTSADGFRLSIIDPYGTTVDSMDGTMPANQDYLWVTSAFDVKFSAAGNYVVRFAFLVDGEYKTVGEKLIVSE
ncbi:MAG: hypothetical protein K0R57_5784 [Paenibacillaceae bacterium]|jgi:hypothetical protein|nr:hypothetical protein [Paenibacillaceae bacterium]